MPWKKSKTIPSLITHYGRWTKQEENDFYDKVNFSDWRGIGGLVPRTPISNHKKTPKIERINDANNKVY